MYSEIQLIRELKQGNDAAFDLFVHEYYEKVLRYCYCHCSDSAYAEDITQETFVRFFTKLSDYHYRGKTLNYLYTIARNLCRDYYKKVKEIPLEKMESAKDFSEQSLEDIQNRIIIDQALNQLPEKLKEVIILYYFQELNMKEIAGVLHIGLPLVKYRLKQAKTKLEKLVREEEAYESGRKNEKI